MTQATQSVEPRQHHRKLPMPGLIALACGGFLTIMTEALPAGILPAMSADLGVGESIAGQTVTIYAIGSTLTAVPLTAMTAGWPRRRLLTLAIAGFAAANAVTAVSTDYHATMVARLIAGIAAGLLWALLAGYARRMVPAHQRGRAMAIAMAGTPVALSIGVPAGTFVAGIIGWRWTFGAMTLLSLALIAGVIAAVPPIPGAAHSERTPLRRVLRVRGVAPVLAVTLTFVLAHNILYTYIAPFLAPLDMGARVDAVLLAFGIASLVSILVTGVLIDRHLRGLMIAANVCFGAAALVLGLLASVPPLVFVAAVVWGLGFGGAATLLQTASAEAVGAAGDVAQSLIVTSWNVAIAAGAMMGGVLLSAGTAALPWWSLALALTALSITVTAARDGFPSRARRAERSHAAL